MGKLLKGFKPSSFITDCYFRDNTQMIIKRMDLLGGGRRVVRKICEVEMLVRELLK